MKLVDFNCPRAILRQNCWILHKPMNQDEIMTASGNTFGRYTLSGRIAVGGMAEVYRGKFTGEKGFEKPVVIKKMLPQIASDEQMVQFFIDEARLSALLQHENIVCIYDFGELEGSYYLAMEYLQGQDLNNILKRATYVGNPLKLADILWIASRLCNGLEYAHTLKDLTGRPLDIIHRDISPQNVFITYEGNVKILDFGVAKTAMQSTLTRVGIAKGKMAYMSPEQLEAKTIDHRSDIFAVGILLYEMVTQSRMYSGDTTAAVFDQVMRADFEPPEIRNPNLDPNLVAIINKALQKDPAERFQSCHEMQAAIDDCIFQLSLRPSNKTLSEYVASLFPESCSNSQPQSTSAEYNSTFIGDDLTVAMDKTEYLSKETVAVDLTNWTMASSAGGQSPSSPDSNRPLASQPEVKRSNNLNRIRNWVVGFEVHPAVTVAIVLLLALILTGVHFFEQKPGSETTLKIVQQAENRIETNQLTTPEQDSATFYNIEVPELDSNGNALEKEYEKIAVKYAALAEDALKQSQYNSARSLTEEGLELKPDDERLLSLNKQIKLKELLQKAENRIEVNQLTAPENDCAAFYYSEASKLDPDSNAVEIGNEKIAAKYAVLAEDALKQSQFDRARSLTADGLELKPGDERLLSLNKQIKLKELLQKAENCIEANQLTTPEKDCAAFYYSEASKLDLGSDAAEKGYEKIAVKYAALAEDALKQSQFGRAKYLTAKGLEFKPGNKRLLSLNKQIKLVLLQKAENCIKANALATPEKDCAAFYYSEVSRLYADSDAEEKGHEKIAGKYADLAENALKQVQYESARSYTSKGLEFKADDLRLLSLNNQIKQELIQKAENCIEANQLTTPEKDCAAFYYSEVSRLYADSDAVEKGHEKIAGKYADLAEDALNQYQFDSARYLTASGLEFKPDDERLLSLSKQLSTNKVGLFFKNIGKGIKNTID